MKVSAGLLVYRIRNREIEVFLIHPGGPYWMKKDDGAWSIPKGEIDEGESSLEAAKREFLEETGFQASGSFRKLEPIKQSSQKIVEAWIMEGDYDPAAMKSNTFEAEWPPKSGRMQKFPEADRSDWFSLKEARKKILKGQLPLLDQLETVLNA